VNAKAKYLFNLNKLSDKTLCMTGVQGDKSEFKHFDVHNLYGYMQSIPTYAAVEINANRTRPFVVSRSTFLGSGKYGGHWTGDNHAVGYLFYENFKNSFYNLENFS
jgi:alpha-glucosidase (family GH31 glycosyl hydrolase)